MTHRAHEPKEVENEIAALWLRAPITLRFKARSQATYYRHQLYYARKQLITAYPEIKTLGVFVNQQGDDWILEIRSKNAALLAALEEAGIPVGPPELNNEDIDL